MLFENLGQLLYSTEAAEHVEVGRHRPGWHGRLSTGLAGQFHQTGKENRRPGDFLVGLAVHTGVVE